MLFCYRTHVEYGEKDSRTNAANGFELTCGAVSMRARFAHETKLLLIYEMHFQTADCLDKRARACRDGRLSELLVATARV
jgi:hypothetical protein